MGFWRVESIILALRRLSELLKESTKEIPVDFEILLITAGSVVLLCILYLLLLLMEWK